MERLTKRNPRGEAYYPYCFKENTCAGNGRNDKCNHCSFDYRICDKLAAYEDIGLEPEQIIEMDRLYFEKCREVNKLKNKLRRRESKMPIRFYAWLYEWFRIPTIAKRR
ncbi:MAG: hypothetical protein E7267_03790 [Lachnospiraceae bacterium]|nr:hypothetical protein [Lachnospiraceae bacterium]